jgi:NAD(P)-dependent dehydrogenase (short-subunit alcohol dehydrogenase family)
MTGRLTGKVAIVTGSTRGLGAAVAREMAKEGASLAITGRNSDDGERIAREITDAGGTAAFIRLDLADEASVQRCVQETVQRFGKLNVLVNNAAPTEYITGATTGKDGKLIDKADGSVAALSTDGWRKVMTAGLDGLFWTLHYSIPPILEAGGGSIVNISSTASLLGIGGTDAYTATKGAMNALTRSVAVNYAPTIRCNTLVAGAFATEGLAPLLSVPEINQAFLDTILHDRIADPSAMAGPVIFFASDESYYITGQCLPVDGGMSIKMAVPKLSGAMPETADV